MLRGVRAGLASPVVRGDAQGAVQHEGRLGGCEVGRQERLQGGLRGVGGRGLGWGSPALALGAGGCWRWR